MEKIDRLVEKVAERLYFLEYRAWKRSLAWQHSSPRDTNRRIKEAKKILSHPDLALMLGKSINLPGEGMTWETYYHAIPLAEALEEAKK